MALAVFSYICWSVQRLRECLRLVYMYKYAQIFETLPSYAIWMKSLSAFSTACRCAVHVYWKWFDILMPCLVGVSGMLSAVLLCWFVWVIIGHINSILSCSLWRGSSWPKLQQVRKTRLAESLAKQEKTSVSNNATKREILGLKAGKYSFFSPLFLFHLVIWDCNDKIFFIVKWIDLLSKSCLWLAVAEKELADARTSWLLVSCWIMLGFFVFVFTCPPLPPSPQETSCLFTLGCASTVFVFCSTALLF